MDHSLHAYTLACTTGFCVCDVIVLCWTDEDGLSRVCAALSVEHTVTHCLRLLCVIHTVLTLCTRLRA